MKALSVPVLREVLRLLWRRFFYTFNTSRGNISMATSPMDARAGAWREFDLDKP